MNLQKKLNQALDCCKKNELLQAEKIYLHILRKYPKNIDANINLGVIKIQQQQFKEAEKYLKAAWAFGKSFNALDNLIIMLMQSGDYDQAYELSQYLKESKDFFDKAQFYQARSLMHLKKIDESLSLYQSLYKENPENINILVGYGYVNNLIGNYNKSKEIYEEALKINPNSFEANYNLGLLYNHGFRNWNESIKYLDHAAKINDNLPDLYLTQAVNYKKLRKIETALACCDKAYQLNKNNPFTLFQIGSFKAQLGCYDEGINWMQEAYKLKPDYYHAPFQIGLTLLGMSKFKEAHEYYKYRIKETKVRFNDLDINHLEPDKKVLIHWEQGIGDTIFYSKLIHEVNFESLNVTFVVQNKITNFIKHNLRNISNLTVISDSEYQENIEKFLNHVAINMASITRYFDPLKKNYEHKFNINYMSKNDHKKLKNDHKRIAISWKSTAEKVADDKSFSILEIIKAVDLNNFELTSIQYGNIDELANLNKSQIFIDNKIDYFDDIDSVLKIIESSDIVITCSNTNAHLAGALGKETLLLLPKDFGKIWYWNQLQNQRSYWYPSIKIIKQDRDGDWGNCYKEVTHHLSS